MPATFVKSLFSGRANATFGLTLSGSAVVSVGNTIFVAIGSASSASSGYSVTDNLGNVYSQVAGGVGSEVVGARLFRADVTKPGTLTAINIGQPDAVTIGAMSAEFSGVGPVRGTGTIAEDNNNYTNVYPGGSASTFAPYLAGDLWIGVASVKSNFTFVATGSGANAASSEPTPEQAGTGCSVGWLYYIAGVNSSGNIRMVGTWSSFRASVGAGVAFQPAAVAIVYNDAPSGSIAFTGTRVESWRRVYTDAFSGSVALSGAIIESVSKIYSDAQAGSIALGGSVSESNSVTRIYTDSPAGAIAFTGSVVESTSSKTVYTDTPAGVLRLAGSATDSAKNNYIDVVAGALLLAGSAKELVGKPGVLFVQALFAGNAKGTGAPLVLSGNKVVSAGNTIFVAFGSTAANDPLPTITDNLGNSYSSIGARATGVGRTALYRADVKNSGTLTAITVDQPPGDRAYGAIAAEFANAGLVRGIGFSSAPAGDYRNAYPGGDAVLGLAGTDIDDYIPGDLWIGAFQQSSVATFGAAPGSGKVAAVEPSPEQRTAGGTAVTNTSVGLLYYTSSTPQTAALVGRYSAPGQGYGVGAAVALRVGVVGSIQLTGSVSVRHVFADTRAGTLALSGTCVTKRVRSDAPSGRIALSGSAVDVWFIRTVHIDAPTGTVGITGTSVDFPGHLSKPAGRIAISGTATRTETHDSAPSGSLPLTGSSTAKRRYVDSPEGALELAGAAEDGREIADVSVGVLRLIGVASESLAVSTHVDGTVRLAGRNSEFITIDDDIFYDDFPGGLLEFAGKVVVVNEAIQPGRSGRIVRALETGRIVRHLESGRVVGNLTGRLTS